MMQSGLVNCGLTKLLMLQDYTRALYLKVLLNSSFLKWPTVSSETLNSIH